MTVIIYAMMVVIYAMMVIIYAMPCMTMISKDHVIIFVEFLNIK
jgi:hypothetical protein